MSLPYHPRRGEVLICNFDGGFTPPEMVKCRPVVVVSDASSHGRGLCSVVPLSSTQPDRIMAWHHALPTLTVPGMQTVPRWAKCDMVATVAFRRLNAPYLRSRSGRRYINTYLPTADLEAVAACLRAYLAL